VSVDPFAALGLPRAQAIDGAELDRRLRERARELHPDRAAPAGRAAAAARSAELFAAHRCLKDPLARAAALLALEGRAARGQPPGEFLEAQLAARERLAAGDAGAAGDARAALAACEARLAALLVPGAAPAALDEAEATLVRARFHASLLREEAERDRPDAARAGRGPAGPAGAAPRAGRAR
jgi:hypothetical protein